LKRLKHRWITILKNLDIKGGVFVNDKMNNTEKQALVDWNSVSLGKLTLSSDYGTSKKTNDNTGIPVLRMGNMKDGKIVLDNLVFLELENSEFQRLKLYPGDILINRTNSADLVGKVSIFDLDGDYVCASYIVRFKINQEIINPYYLNYYMNMSDSQNRIKTIATQAIQQANINPTTLKKSFIVKFPKSKHEQDKIVNIISTWDKAIELKEKLIEEKKKQKTGLMQKLLTGKVRLSGFDKEWVNVKLKKILKQRNEKSEIKEGLELYSLTIEDGVTPKSDRYNREFLVKSGNKKYKITKCNDIVYNPANLRFGAIAVNRIEQSVLLSPIYEVLYIKDEKKYDIDFVGQLLTWDRNIKYFSTMAEGTLVERMAVKIDAFLDVAFKFPPSLEEQKAIASILSLADKEICILKKEMISLKKQKKGLMQLLLTGIVRVNTQES
jgi:type I restriction enzyme S subunit